MTFIKKSQPPTLGFSGYDIRSETDKSLTVSPYRSNYVGSQMGRTLSGASLHKTHKCRTTMLSAGNQCKITSNANFN